VLEIKRYKRTGYNFEVYAVRVTEDNIQEVALWADAQVCVTQDSRLRKYVRVYTLSSKSPIRKAFLGDWVIRHDHGAKKIYTNDAFHKSFDLVERDERWANEILREYDIISEEEYQDNKSKLDRMAVAE
jgi:hypothetical protein